MKNNHIEQCICASEQIESLKRGMPILMPLQSEKEWTIKCPNCGRGGCMEFKSPYLAIKHWNKFQAHLKDIESNGLFEHDKEGE